MFFIDTANVCDVTFALLSTIFIASWTGTRFVKVVSCKSLNQNNKAYKIIKIMYNYIIYMYIYKPLVFLCLLYLCIIILRTAGLLYENTLNRERGSVAGKYRPRAIHPRSIIISN